MREDARDLVKMRQVVSDPGGEKLAECDRAESGMLAPPGKVSRLQIHSSQIIEALRTSASEFVE